MANEIGPGEAKKLLDEGKAVALDVREKVEIEFASIGEHIWIPMNELVAKYTELPKGKMIIVVCRTGSRSGVATQFLRGKGIDAKNLKGGIFSWNREVDVKVRPYTYSFEGDRIVISTFRF